MSAPIGYCPKIIRAVMLRLIICLALPICAYLLAFGNCQWLSIFYLFQKHVFSQRADLYQPPKGYSGIWRTWYPNGRLESERNYIDGKREGRSRQWFENGGLQTELAYSADLPNGKWTWWDIDGNVTLESMWQNGVQVTEHTYLSPATVTVQRDNTAETAGSKGPRKAKVERETR